MDTRFFWILMALLMWGLYGFFPKLTVRYIDAHSAVFYQAIGGLLMGLFSLYVVNFRPSINPQGVFFAVLTGASAAIGGFFYLKAADMTSISIVAPITAMYPIVTILLAFILLQEQLSWRQLIGIGLSMVAIWLMAGE